jgi:hypothetical protein
MITTLLQAKAVQTRRVAAKKRGYSKAVRTFLRKECTKAVGSGTNFDVNEYMDLRSTLPVTWFKPAVKK